MRLRHVLSLLLLLLAFTPARADEDAAAWAKLDQRVKAAFKPLKVLTLKKADKQLGSSVPVGIVTVSAPFDGVIAQLRREHTVELLERHRVIADLGVYPAAKCGPALGRALDGLGKEDALLAKQIALVEKAYAPIFHKGAMSSSVGEQRQRKLAAILIPYYRSIRLENRTLAREAANVLAGRTADADRDWLQKNLGSGPSAPLRAVIAYALGKHGGDGPRETLARQLVKDKDVGVRSACLAALCRFPTKDVGDAWVAALKDSAWEVRALAVEAIRRGGYVDATEALIEQLASEDGRLRTDIDEALHALVGARFYGEVELWRKFWEDDAAKVKARAATLRDAGEYDKAIGAPEEWADEDADDAGESTDRGATSAFYGITTRSKQVLFVIDISFSMDNPAGGKPAVTGTPKDPYPFPDGNTKMAVAQWQLHRAIRALPPDAVFNIVVYSESYAVWREEMTAASKGNKKKAHAFVDELVSNGTTNIGDSLDKAFELAGLGGVGPRTAGLALDTVFLLSDGAPNRGRIAELAELLADVTRRNRTARLVFHTVGIGEAAGSSFLKDLARRHRGRYVGFK